MPDIGIDLKRMRKGFQFVMKPEPAPVPVKQIIPIVSVEAVQPVPVTVITQPPDRKNCAARLHGRFVTQQIIRHIAAVYGIDARTITSPDRHARVVRARHIAMYLSRHITKASMPWIGRQFGGRDHTTVLSGIRKMEALSRIDFDFAAELAQLESFIRSANRGQA